MQTFPPGGAPGAPRDTHPLAMGVAPDTIDVSDVVRRMRAAEATPAPPDPKRMAKHRLNDLGNARRLISRYGGDLAFVPERGWGAWDGRRWQFDTGEHEAMMRAQETAEAIWDEIDHAPDTRRDVMSKWARASGNHGGCRAMLNQAAPHLLRSHDMLDADPWSLNVENGTLRLKGGIVRDLPARSDWITKMAAVSYDADAPAERWRRFVGEVLPEREVAVFVQKWLGYCLTSDISEQKVVQFEGKGANGKSTLLEVVARIMGDYAQIAPIETFLHQDRRSGSGPSPDIARLPGARLVRASEPEPGARLSESIIKQWTGGEKMVARHLHKDFFEFTPQGKLTLSVNIRPVIVGKDHGIKRRIVVVPFTQRFKPGGGSARGTTLVDDLMAERSGILNWLLDGLRLWLDDGLDVPPSIVAATESYFTEMDPIGAFMREATTVTEVIHDKVSSTELFGAYQKWCRMNNEDEKSQTAFGRRMGDLGVKKITSSGRVFYLGLHLDPEWRADTGGRTEQED